MAEGDNDNITERYESVGVPQDFLQHPGWRQQEFVRETLTKAAKANGDRLVEVSIPATGSWTLYPVKGDPSGYMIQVAFKTAPADRPAEE
ncbi:hypothetical protein QN239_25710 [Mycolicibacterium sp. Y3]